MWSESGTRTGRRLFCHVSSRIQSFWIDQSREPPFACVLQRTKDRLRALAGPQIACVRYCLASYLQYLRYPWYSHVL